eukprot:scaffold3685_cov102-Isochrysis_galbana.AAC.4
MRQISGSDTSWMSSSVGSAALFPVGSPSELGRAPAAAESIPAGAGSALRIARGEPATCRCTARPAWTRRAPRASSGSQGFTLGLRRTPGPT